MSVEFHDHGLFMKKIIEVFFVQGTINIYVFGILLPACIALSEVTPVRKFPEA